MSYYTENNFLKINESEDFDHIKNSGYLNYNRFNQKIMICPFYQNSNLYNQTLSPVHSFFNYFIQNKRHGI